MDELAPQIKQLVEQAQHIVVVQADNPDGDSLGSALALEHILGDLGKRVSLYCGVDIPSYLHYLAGWDRVQKELPSQFDASIIVDASTLTLLEKLDQTGQLKWLATKPCAVLDHHASVEQVVPFATVMLNDSTRSSAGELIYAVARTNEWPLSIEAQTCLLTAILGDTQGLTNQLASAETYRIVASMIADGVDRPALEEIRREASKMPLDILRYKAKLIEKAEFWHDNHVATVDVPQEEITKFSPLYNPAPLIQGDLLQTQDVLVTIVFKHYADGKVTGAIRCNPGAGIGADLATKMGGGGHAFASGFKVTDGRPFNEIKSECIREAGLLLATILEQQKDDDETIQYAYTTD